jgi:NitT/TauT family transport system permease protein
MHKKNISKDRQRYLRKIWIKKTSILLTQIGIVIAFIVIWEISANKGLIDSFITSQPSRILKTFMNLSENKLLMHLWVTCEETLIGFLLGVLIGTVIAMLLWWSDFLSKVSEPFLVVLNSLPKVALGPIIIIWVRCR